MLTLTERQRAVLAHVVVDADQWLDDAVAAFGETPAATMLADKVARHAAAFDAAAALPGYRTRAEREADAAR